MNFQKHVYLDKTQYSRRKEKHEIIRSNQNRHSTYRTRNRVRQQQKKQARTWGEVSPSPGQSKRKAPADTQTQTLKLTSNYAQQKTAHMHTHIIQDRALPCTIINRDVYEFVAVFVRMICITRLPAIESWRHMGTSHHATGASDHAPWATAEIKGIQRISSVYDSAAVFVRMVSITCHGILTTPRCRCHRSWGSPQHDFRLRALRSNAQGYWEIKEKI